MSARKPLGWAAGFADLKSGLKAWTVARMGELWVGEWATQWMKLGGGG